MRAFYRTRLAKHQTKLLRYLKYVLNDHVVLIGGFIFGGAALYYADAVKTLDSDFVFGKPLLALLWFAALFAGNLATLIHPADTVFLLPKETQMKAYFKASFRHSLSLPTLVLFLISAGSMPLLIPVAHATVSDFVFYFSLLLVLKISQLLQQGQHFLQNNRTRTQQTRQIWLIFSMGAIVASLYVASWVGLVLSLILVSLQAVQLNTAYQQHLLDWHALVATEQQRLKRIYQFINLFTDVPGMSGQVKRRKFLDPLLRRIHPAQRQTYRYLYARSFLRGSEYGQLVLRLTLVGALALVFANDFLISLLLSLVILYLIGFQLLPLYSHFDYMVMTQLYPVPASDKPEAFVHFVQTVLSVVGLVFGLLNVVLIPTWSHKLLILSAIALEVVIFSRLYAPRRLKKIDRR